MAETAVAKTVDSALPAYLQGGKTTRIGNVDQSDIIIPRVKLMQSVSPEVEAYDEAKLGNYWHTLAEKSLGTSLDIIPIFMKKEIVVWAPRGDDRGILARSSDCVNWDDGYENLEFTVKLKGMPKPWTFNTKANVAASRLMEFGQVNDDPDSRPFAALTYRFMFLFPEHMDLGPAIVINTRSDIKAAKGLISKVELRPVDHYGQKFTMTTVDKTGDEGPYKGYSYTSNGFATEEQYLKGKELYELYKDKEWKTNDDNEEAPADGGAAGGSKGKAATDEEMKSAKF